MNIKLNATMNINFREIKSIQEIIIVKEMAIPGIIVFINTLKLFTAN